MAFVFAPVIHFSRKQNKSAGSLARIPGDVAWKQNRLLDYAFKYTFPKWDPDGEVVYELRELRVYFLIRDFCREIYKKAIYL